MQHQVIVDIGSNIEPQKHIDQAIAAIQKTYQLVALSKFVWTEPLIFKEQPKFLNGSALIKTPLDRETLRHSLKRLEKEIGRVKTANKSGPRVIDLDIVVFDGTIVDKAVFERDFLYQSVRELLPALFEEKD